MEEETQKPWWHDSLMSFIKMASWIVGPILVGLFVGDWLDKKFNTSPWLEISLMIIMFGFSVYHLVKDGKKYEEELEHNQNHIEKDGNRTT